jgi:methylated-DNA-[protein]-cysteine S-methyltransferase
MTTRALQRSPLRRKAPQSLSASVPQCLRLFDTPCGRMGVVATACGLVRVLLPNEVERCGSKNPRQCRGLTSVAEAMSGRVTRRDPPAVPGASVGERDPQAGAVAAQAEREICEYLAGSRREFSVPIDTASLPPFHKKVLLAARKIPFGKTETYAALAARVGNPRAARAVGQAMARNPLALVLPCHRVVATGGGLGGYGGGLDLKRRLLVSERAGRGGVTGIPSVP